MKILKKSEIQSEVARTRREQIDEGIALATKVDMLRNTVGNLEQQEERFIIGMKANLQREIEPLKKEKDSLLYQIRVGTDELNRLRQPLDAEWTKAKLSSESATTKLQALNIREHQLIEAEEDIKKQRESISAEKDEAISMKDEAKDSLSLASDIKSEADRILRKVKIDSEHKIAELAKMESGLTKWGQELHFREIDLDSREAFVTQRDRDLTDKERFINDKYETLMRTMKRVKI